MFNEIVDFINENRVCVVAVEMSDGSPHAATVHFANNNDLLFIIQTNPEYRKAEPLLKKESVRVSIVVGTTEDLSGKDKTFQLDGKAQIIESDSELIEMYLTKFPEKRGKWANDIFFKVTPTWWRYTDWGKSNGKTVFNSNEKFS